MASGLKQDLGLDGFVVQSSTDALVLAAIVKKGTSIFIGSLPQNSKCWGPNWERFLPSCRAYVTSLKHVIGYGVQQDAELDGPLLGTDKVERLLPFVSSLCGFPGVSG